ncbi:DUF4124 domain-containing protein [Rhodanobacter sp. AS-Z3]|uniref:DUF4124 domain-containing protein n=1 Tax=Rhodanobacter sp. AS-Z3 TaxID=3031330 RepID=UPI00247A174E|nr:DUF4124 domain-containing protein [Rhodanobacter sp. AS-Z3]WEN16114.1 DUF4124 domain-containing protein [Rhodanobacter sp. AS-Z3]
MYRLVALLLLCLIALACVAPAAAQTPIHRCIGANGQAVFTDQPCMALQATPVAPGASSTPAVANSVTPPMLCAHSFEVLRQAVIEAFASRDANRLAGMMLWEGYGRGAAIADIRSLAQVMKQPLLDVSSPTQAADPDDPASMPLSTAPPTDDQLVLHVVDNDGNGGPRELRFDIVHQAGCLWLRSTN